jgi:hypothetical protein
MMWDTCTPEAAALTEALGGLLRASRAGRDALAPLSLFFGRVVELPLLSPDLVRAARESPEWDARAGRPRSGDLNRFVAGLLLNSAALRDLLPDYTITSVSVEKVLVPTRDAMRARKAGDPVPAGRLPYDAMLWVRLKRKH